MASLIARKDADVAPPLITDVGQVRVTIYMGYVSFMILIWDHIVTFADEVEYIWKGKKGLLVSLFLLNRYLTPLGFVINLFAYQSPVWTVERCLHFVRYEGSMTVIGINTTALMMLLRISALYHRRPFVIAFVAAFFCVELGINAWLLTHGTAVVHQRQVHACTMVFDDAVTGPIASASAWLPLTYDTIVLILTLKRTLGPIRRKTAGKIARVLLRDGILYYSVIFSVNFVLTIMIAAAPSGLQNITAQLEYLLTVAMMSRITLHLRKQVRSREIDEALVSYKFPSTMSVTHLRSRLRFARSDGHSTGAIATAGSAGDVNVNVVVDQTSVMHDDKGNVIVDAQDDFCSPEDDADLAAADAELRERKSAAVREWYELRPPPPVRIETGRIQAGELGSQDVRFIV